MENNQNTEKNFEVTYQQLANYVAGFLVLSFFIFIAGYYWGKKSGIEPFTQKLENDSLEDKMYYAFCALNEVSAESDTANLENHDHTSDQVSEAVNGETVDQKTLDNVKKDLVVDSSAQKVNSKLYFVQLSGFGSLKSAQAFFDKLKNRGFEVKIVEREGRRKGKKINWYQVITEPTENKENLEAQMQQIKKIVKLDKVEILSINKN